MTEILPEIKKEKRKRQKPGDLHYVNNKEFTAALHLYAVESKRAIAAEEPRTVMSKYLGECVIKMSERLSLTPRFRGYPFRDEMVQNGILGAVKYMYRFDGTRFNNGFAYVTQILFSHMIITIKNEKKKYKMNLELIQNNEALQMGNGEFEEQSNEHARVIAEQKLLDMEVAQPEKGKAGFILRTGYTKASREAYEGGTPMDEFLTDEERANKDD